MSLIGRTAILFLLSSLMVSLHARESLNPENDSSDIDKKLLTTGIVGGSAAYLGATAYLFHSIYEDDNFEPFHFYNDSRSFLQVDKLQHIFGTYAATYAGYNFFHSAGLNREKSLFYSGSLGFLLAVPKEIFDGFLDGTGFSVFDFTANLIGSAFFTGQELLFRDQIMKIKFSFHRSEYAEQSNGYLGRNILDSYFNDYNGHTYWLSINANKLMMKDKLPPWLNIAAGYSANGMFGAFENIDSYRSVIIPETERYRQYLISLDVDWPKINTQSGFLNTMCKLLVFIKLPFPALEFNSKGEFKGHWIYF